MKAALRQPGVRLTSEETRDTVPAAEDNVKQTFLGRFITIWNIPAHLHLYVIQTYCGLKLGEASGGGVWIAVHVGSAGAAIQLPPAAITLPLFNSRRNPGKMSIITK